MNGIRNLKLPISSNLLMISSFDKGWFDDETLSAGGLYFLSGVF